MLEYTLRAEHLPIVLTVELDLLARMDLAIPYSTVNGNLFGAVGYLGLIGNTHGKCC